LNGTWNWRGLACALFAALVAACETTPPPPEQANITDEVLVEAKVLAVDKAAREITLQPPSGSKVVVVAGPEVRNFDQIEAGNTVKVAYAVSLSARRLKPDEADLPPAAELLAARSEEGAAPGGFIGAGVEVMVTVKSVDKEQHIVVFTADDEILHAVQARRDEGKRFVAGLKPGDRVELIYAEAVAISVN